MRLTRAGDEGRYTRKRIALEEAVEVAGAGDGALGRRVVHIEDTSNDPDYTDTDARRLGQFRTTLAVPLFREDAVIGGIFLARSRVEPFSEKQVELVRPLPTRR